MQKTGKIIVFDGADGSGKATQTNLAVEKLISLGHCAEKIDFPRYEANIFGKLIGEFQCSETMEFSKVHPVLASLPYALDRLESKPLIESWLRTGHHVICDRYVSANQLHQGGKIKDEGERKRFLDLLDTVEHGLLGLPRPDLVILLDVPQHVSVRLMKEKASTTKKQYSQRTTDFVEQDHEYLLNARESGIKMIADRHWIRIQCSEDGETLLPIETIHEMAMSEILKVIN